MSMSIVLTPVGTVHVVVVENLRRQKVSLIKEAET
jgi:hypothetical protein